MKLTRHGPWRVLRGPAALTLLVVRYYCGLNSEGQGICPGCRQEDEPLGAFAAPLGARCARCGRLLLMAHDVEVG